MHRSSKQFSRGLRQETTRCWAVAEDLRDRYLDQRLLRRRSRRSATVSPTFVNRQFFTVGATSSNRRNRFRRPLADVVDVTSSAQVELALELV